MGEGEGLALPSAWEDLRQETEQRIPAPRRAWRGRTFRFVAHRHPHRRGTRGERLAADQIDCLVNGSTGWHALHGTPGKHVGIEHLVIGPCGVIAVHVEDRPRGRVWVSGETMLVDGEPTQCLQRSREAAARIGQVLSAAVGYDVAVTAFVVTVGAELRVRHGTVGVGVCTRLELAERLYVRAKVLGPDDIEELYAAARRLGAWRDGEPAVA
jgi:hypothetical protein